MAPCIETKLIETKLLRPNIEWTFLILIVGSQLNSLFAITLASARQVSFTLPDRGKEYVLRDSAIAVRSSNSMPK